MDSNKISNIVKISIPEGGKKENGAEKVFEEIMGESFSTWWKKHTYTYKKLSDLHPVKINSKKSYQDTS